MSKKQPFGKFIEKESGAKKKEQIRQEKRAAREEKNAYFEKIKQERRQLREGAGPRQEDNRNQSTPFRKGGKKFQQEDRPQNKFGNRKNTSGNSDAGADRRKFPAGDRDQNRFAKKKTDGSFANNRSEENKFKSADKAAPKKFVKKDAENRYGADSPISKNFYAKKEASQPNPEGKLLKAAKPFAARSKDDAPKKDVSKKFPNPESKGPGSKAARSSTQSFPAKKSSSQKDAKATDAAKSEQSAPRVMPLNKFIAHAGITSRRDAADIVKSGKVIVNGKVVTEPGFKVNNRDEVKVNGKKVVASRNFVYILLNKPKDYLTTTNDPEGRKTVLDIIKNATEERVYPIGRLDRNTTGVLLLTNDGELTQKLSHPSYQIKKIYEVTLDKPLLKKDFDLISKGIDLEDGFIAPDILAYADSKDKSIIGVEIHSGRNRIVRRIFEHMGYDVRNLDRVMYANLTKKNVERGKYRFLSEKEVRLLKFLNSSFTKKS